MERTLKIETQKENILKDICNYLGVKQVDFSGATLKEMIKELCVARLCKAVGITGKYNYKSSFFDFFSSIMGEAVCDKLKLKIHVASDELRLIKYERINLIEKVKLFLENETTEEAFIDAFNLADKFKYLIPKLKKV